MDIEFKEKPYEKFFGHELARLTNVTYSPDQCDEAVLGFDEAFFMPEEWFSRFGPYTYISHRRRRRLTGLRIDEFNELGKINAKYMPNFKFNLFLQFKRPSFLNSHRAKQWADWKQSYYRYETTPHQQEALERIDAQSFGRAAVLYASPAFGKTSELWKHVKNEDVVNQSNMADAGKLKGHKHYSYIKPGFLGKGHSEAVEIESEPLSQVIRNGLERNEPLPLNQHLKKTASAIIEATSNGDLVTPDFHQVQTALGFEEFNPNSLYDATRIIEVFSQAFDVRHYSIG